MVSIIRLRFVKHTCDDELLLLQSPDPMAISGYGIQMVRELLETTPSPEEEGMSRLDILHKRIDQFNRENAYMIRIISFDKDIYAGF